MFTGLLLGASGIHDWFVGEMLSEDFGMCNPFVACVDLGFHFVDICTLCLQCGSLGLCSRKSMGASANWMCNSVCVCTHSKYANSE